ncbi:oligosaccharide flippase family protein [Capnocytophaga leadbetteri]|uniref:lipopolysaccharide biosynthesis protein n=1 Tax=Capnocytophaga leadbetteri TaxID=327575 RepID=UPI0028EAF4E9|nr:oligosaccharide flippase family protein [Capnocytophaga leadbetteri]
MGIVLRQSFKNVVATYFGFAIGALNTLFLFIYFLSKAQYGLVSYVTSTATILSPFISFGVHNTWVRYYSAYTDRQEQAKLNLMLCFLPLLVILPATLLGSMAYEQIAQWLSAKNSEVRPYIWLIFLTAVAMAYFEIAYAWMRVQLKTVFGNFLKEVFHRVGVMLLLVAIYFGVIDFHQFMWGVFGVYTLRMLLMMVTAFYVRRPTFSWGLPQGKKEVFLYSLFIILSGSVASLLMDIDKFMLNQYLPIGEIAVYNVAIFTATVIAIPYRSMYQIVSPLTAQFMNQGKAKELSDLYKRSTINTYFVSMVICVLIIVNAQQCYALLPDKDYSTGLGVLIIISVVKLSDALVGFNNAVLLNSPYYRTVLFLGVFLVIGTVLMNMWLIPLYGINGAGIATLIAFTSYNLLKSVFVYRKYGLQPFYKETLQTSLFGIITIGGFFFWDFPFHPIVNISLKSLLVGVLSVFFLLKFNLSQELVKLIRRSFILH